MYHNEDAVGRAIRELSLSRSELYVTTKFFQFPETPDPVEALKLSLQKVHTSILDEL